MRRVGWPLLALVLGCQEYDLIGDPAIYGSPNPPDLSTPVRTDRIVQVTVPAVDVLWVIDNSCSMSAEQERLVQTFPEFMSYFAESDLDYHIGVVSTDMDDPDHAGKLQAAAGFRWIDRDTPAPYTVFSAMANLGIYGAIDERGRDAAWTALVIRRDTENYGFYREEAALSIIVISDEDDASGDDLIPLPLFVQALPALKERPGMVRFSSIVGPPGGCPSATTAGTSYLVATEAIGGIAWSICDEDWTEVLERLGMEAAGFQTEFFLSEVPVPESVRVWVEVDGEPVTHPPELGVTLDWTYDRARNSIRFDTYVPPALAEVFIEYQVLAAAQEIRDSGL